MERRNFSRGSGRSGNPRRGGGGGGYRAGGGGGRGGGRDEKPDYPILLGEPSPSLARIRLMNIEKLEAKIASLIESQERLAKRIVNLSRSEPPDTEKIERNKLELVRLGALKEAAEERLQEKLRRKAEWEAKRG